MDFDAAAEGCDLAVAIPLHRRRHRVRGFNQSLRLLLPLARQRRILVERRLLERVVETTPQARLTARERQRNLRGAFQASERVEGRRILLVDDVATTLATLNAAARALRQAGATHVSAYVVARARAPG
jgi:ComF family protein